MPEADRTRAHRPLPPIQGAQRTFFRSGWIDTLSVLAFVMLPVALTSATISIGIRSLVWWQLAHGVPIRIPAWGAIVVTAMGLYVVFTWITIFGVWRWTSRRGMTDDVFVFRRLTWTDAAVGMVGFLLAMDAAPPILHAMSAVLGQMGPGRPFNLQHAPVMALFVLSDIVTAPLGEEVLYRGLLVAWFQRLGWPIPIVWLLGSLFFGASHLIRYGLAWSATMACFGALLFGVRFWRRSLTPVWLLHLLFNMRATVILPLVAWLVHAPGY